MSKVCAKTGLAITGIILALFVGILLAGIGSLISYFPETSGEIIKFIFWVTAALFVFLMMPLSGAFFTILNDHASAIFKGEPPRELDEKDINLTECSVIFGIAFAFFGVMQILHYSATGKFISSGEILNIAPLFMSVCFSMFVGNVAMSWIVLPHIKKSLSNTPTDTADVSSIKKEPENTVELVIH